MADIEVLGPAILRAAGAAVTAYRAGVLFGGTVVHGDNTVPGHRGLIAGIFPASADLGEEVALQVEGPEENPAWAWTPKLPVYLGAAGELTQTVPNGGFIRPLGVAETATALYLHPAPTNDDEGQLSLPFAYGDATPAVIGTAPAGLLRRVELCVTQAFNGSGAALKVGRSGALDELMQTGQNDPAAVGTYETNPGVTYAVGTELLLSITPGAGATAGAGLLIITYHR